MTDLLDRFTAILGGRHVLTDPADQAPHLREWRDLFVGRTRAVLRPGSTAEVAAILALAHETSTAIVPQGGNTGLVGGQIPDPDGQALVLSLSRLDRVRAVDAEGDTLIAEAGVTLARAQGAAESVGRLFPLSLASEGSCTIGGNLATNAGGMGVLAYGNARDLCLGLEVVLADGRVLNALSRLRKDNTGYDLKNLFIGSEGTLGVITAASLRLVARPKAQAVALIGVPDPAAALAILRLARESVGASPTLFELMDRTGLDFVLRHAPGARDPMAEPHPWYVLLELSTGHGDIEGTMATVLEAALEQDLARDAAVAASLDQARALLHLRAMLSEVQRFEGGSIKHDVSVPVADVPAFLDAALAAVKALVPGCRPVPFGHLGDGNIHFNVSQPVGADKGAYLAGWEAMNTVVHAIVARFHGSISAEHGIGRLKRDLLPGVKDPVALDLMRTLKGALDPRGILNPGAVL